MFIVLKFKDFGSYLQPTDLQRNNKMYQKKNVKIWHTKKKEESYIKRTSIVISPVLKK